MNTNQDEALVPLQAQYRRGDRLLLIALLVYALGAVAVALFRASPGLSVGLALVCCLLLAAPAVVGVFVWRGRLASRLLMAFSLSALVMLHIQAGAGLIELHFGVFVTLAILMAYLDWRPVVLSAALFAVHHLVFDRLQAAGLGLYCLATPDIAIILLHATYVVLQTLFEVLFVVRLARMVSDNAEVALLAGQLHEGERIALDVTHIPVRSPLAVELKTIIGRMADTMRTARQVSDQILSASQEIATGNENLSQRTESAASNLAQTTSSMEQLTATVRQSAEATHQADALSTNAVAVAQKGGAAVGKVVETMRDIEGSSQKISEIIGVIDGIAFQTNILALNAAVEAARAGEQGRGFAVVATEVRSLAQRSAQAAKEIKTLIDDSVASVGAGSQLVTSAGETMNEIVQSVQQVGRIINEVSASATEQRDGIAQVNVAVSQLDEMTQQNAALVEESSAAAAGLRQQAEQLANVVSLFKLERAASA